MKNQVPVEERTEQEQQNIIKQLRQSIELSHHQMHELVSDQEQFVERITQFNNLAKQKIINKTQLQISSALVYLSEAEKILQYAAGCGKNINRQLIICVLHNQACVYQILWELDECSNYLEALIFNYESLFRQNNQFSVPPSYLNPSSNSQINFQAQKIFGFAGGSEIQYMSRMKDPSLISKTQLKLLIYYYEHCAVSSQLQVNKKALQSAKKAIKTLKNSFHQKKNYLIEQMNNHRSSKLQNIQQKYFLLVNLSEMFQNIDLNQHKQILKSAHFSLQIWANNRLSSTNSQFRTKQQEVLKQKIKNLAIGSIMEIVPKEFNKFTNQAISDQLNDGILGLDQYVLRIFFLSVGYFSVATQLRLIANSIYKNRKQEDKKNSQQYRQSIIYHLIAIIIASLYLPYQCHYILDILASYSKHYSCNLQEYKPIQKESIQKICLLLGFKKPQPQILNSKHTQKLDRSTKQTNNGHNSIQDNQYNMLCKVPILKKANLHKKKQINSKEMDKLQKSKKQNTDLKNSGIKKTRATSKNSRMKRSQSKQTFNIKDKIQKKYSQLQKILSQGDLVDGEKSPIRKLKSNDKQKSYHLSRDKIYSKKVVQKQKDQAKKKLKSDKKLKTQRKTKDQKQQQAKRQKQNTITEDEQIFFYMTKKVTKTNRANINLFSPKQSLKSIGSSRKSTGKKSSLHSSRSTQKQSPRVFTNLHSPIATVQSPYSKGLTNIRKINGQKKSANIKVNSPSNHTDTYKHYF